MEENKNLGSPEENKQKELSPEIKAIIDKDTEQRKKLAEIFSQCWDDETFKKRFIEHPTEVMDEYDVDYDKSKDYVIKDSKEKTITYVLPYENVKTAMIGVGQAFGESAESGPDTRKVLPEGWSLEFIQNTVDTNFIMIPLNPEKLSPEELELVNGGFIIGTVFLIVAVCVAAVGAAVAVAAGVVYVVAAGVAVGAVIAAAAAVAHVAALVNTVAIGNVHTVGWGGSGDNSAQNNVYDNQPKAY